MSITQNCPQRLVFGAPFLYLLYITYFDIFCSILLCCVFKTELKWDLCQSKLTSCYLTRSGWGSSALSFLNLCSSFSVSFPNESQSCSTLWLPMKALLVILLLTHYVFVYSCPLGSNSLPVQEVGGLTKVIGLCRKDSISPGSLLTLEGQSKNIGCSFSPNMFLTLISKPQFLNIEEIS